MVTSLYPFLVETTAYPHIRNMVTSLYPFLVETTADFQSNEVPWGLYPFPVLLAPPPQVSVPICSFPPGIDSIELINDGKQIFGASYGNMYLLSYSSSNASQSDVIGNYSNNGTNWTPAENNTDPPSHFVLTNKDLPYDCVFYPVFDSYNNSLAMAWIENNAVGRLNLKYSEGPGKRPAQVILNADPTPTVPVDISVPGISNTIYIKPYVKNTDDYEKLENIPTNDILIIDMNDNVFNLNAFLERAISPFGYEMTLPKQIKSVRFSQIFKEHIKLECMIGTAPQGATINTNFIPSTALSGIQINIYKGSTYQTLRGTETNGGVQLNRSSEFIYKTYFSDKSGKFTVDALPGRFTFEIIVNTPSINFSQKIV